jgi:arylesterase/paraoxonase
MKNILKVVFGLSLFLVLFVLYIFNATGFFREVEDKFAGEIMMKVPILGAEDMQVSREDHFMLISSDDRAGRRAGNPTQGGLYFLDLKNPLSPPTLLTNSANASTPFYPHGISMVKIDSAKYKVYAVNHPDERVHLLESFILENGQLTADSIYIDELIFTPNDIVAIDEERFYFTNDHGYEGGYGKLAEEYLGLSVSNVIYYDGASFREVAAGIAYANGINYDPVKALLFVASPRGFLVKVYKVAANGDLTFVEDIPCGTGVDNIEFGEDGKLWIGCHPNLIHFGEYAKGKKEISPSEIITIDYRGKGDYTVETIYEDDGKKMSGSTVAATYKDLIFVGNVMDEHFLILKRSRNF